MAYSDICGRPRSTACNIINYVVIIFLVLLLLYKPSLRPPVQFKEIKDDNQARDSYFLNPPYRASVIEEESDIYVEDWEETTISPVYEPEPTQVEEDVITTLPNWITKELILSELKEYTPPRLDRLSVNRTLKEQCDKYTPNEFGRNLNIKPPAISDFLKDAKNPCWKDGSTIHCLPYYYLLGFPKCGTTDLWERLIKHPQQAWSDKELQWWTRERYKRPLNTYTKYFGDKLGVARTNYNKNHNISSTSFRNFITGDGSPSYLWDVSSHARLVQDGKTSTNKPITKPDLSIAHLIKAYTPQSKFVIIMRNPVDVMYSHYLYRPTGRALSPANFHQRVVQIVAMYDDCFRRNSFRACAYDPNLLAESDRQGVRLYHILYVIYLSDWFKIFPREQFHVMRTEDYKNDVHGHMEKLFKFLDVDIPNNNTMTNIAGAKKSNVQKKTPSWNETKNLLDTFVRPFNDALADLLGDKRYSWETS